MTGLNYLSEFAPDGNSMMNYGQSVVCLGTTGDAESVTDENGLLSIKGKVLRESEFRTGSNLLENVQPCWQDPSRILVVEDENGHIWQLGFSWLDAEGWDMTPEIWLSDGEEIEVLFRYDALSDSAGFGLYNNDRILYALQSSRDGEGLMPDDLPELRVDTHPLNSEWDDGCGLRQDMVQAFQTDAESIEMGPGGDSSVQIDDEHYILCNIDSFNYSDDSCGDASENSWILFY